MRHTETADGEFQPAFWRKIDPGTAMFGICLWMFVNAFSYTASDNLLSRPLLYYVRQIGLSDMTWAALMIGNALLLFLALVRRSSLVLRATVGTMSFVLWALYGGAIVAGGLRYHTYPVSGVFDVICGLGCVLSLSQWAMNEDHE